MRGKTVTQETYDAVQTMLKAGVKRTRICEILGYSYCTISWLANSKSFEEYKEYSKESVRKLRARKQAKDAAKDKQAEVQSEMANMTIADKVRKAIGLYGREAREAQVKKEVEAAKKKSVLIMITVDDYNEQLVAPAIAMLNASFGTENVTTDASDCAK